MILKTNSKSNLELWGAKDWTGALSRSWSRSSRSWSLSWSTIKYRSESWSLTWSRSRSRSGIISANWRRNI
jgi:hypothetical protein